MLMCCKLFQHNSCAFHDTMGGALGDEKLDPDLALQLGIELVQ